MTVYTILAVHMCVMCTAKSSGSPIFWHREVPEKNKTAKSSLSPKKVCLHFLHTGFTTLFSRQLKTERKRT